MTEAKHTREPWRARYTTTQDGKGGHSTLEVLQVPCLRLVASKRVDGLYSEQDQADFDLIAASPDLHHVAEYAHEIFRAMADPEHCMHDAIRNASREQWGEWRDAAKEALQKAKGA
ncbi:unnamed protein product [marine sediment metagenome]|uniref:Uncharacterized protein n=1 Tax=marine sediment metagenome TaxID=412755 RepID=X0VG52_9ZZZZ